MQVQSANWRDNGSRGEVDPAVMADIGYTPFDQFEEVVTRAEGVEREDLRESVIKDAGKTAVRPEPTSAQKNANADRFDDANKHLRQREKQILPGQHF